MKFAKYYDRRVGGTGDPGVGGGRHQAPHASTIIHMAAHSAPFYESVSSLPLRQWGSNLDLNHVAKLLIVITAFLRFFFLFWQI